MGLLSGYINTLKGLLSIRDGFRFNFGGIPDVLKQTSPTFRMFLDSDFNSPIENATKKMWADSIVCGIRSKLPNTQFSKNIAAGVGTWIGEKANSFLDRVKLLNKYHHGHITIDQYLDKRSTQIQGTFVNVAQSAKKFAWIGRRVIYNTLENLGVPQPESTIGKVLEVTGIRKVTKVVGDGIEKAFKSEKTKMIIEAGVATFHEGVNRVVAAYKTVKEQVVEPVVTTIADGVKSAATTVVGWAQKGIQTAASLGKKVWKWLTK